jgi:hypothetical protein
VTPVRGIRHPIVIATIVMARGVIYGLSYYFVDAPFTVTHEIYSSGLDPINELDPISLGRVVGHGVNETREDAEPGVEVEVGVSLEQFQVKPHGLDQDGWLR